MDSATATYVNGEQTGGDVTHTREEWDDLVALGKAERSRVTRANSETVIYTQLDEPASTEE
jgi:hypothetical protein